MSLSKLAPGFEVITNNYKVALGLSSVVVGLCLHKYSQLTTEQRKKLSSNPQLAKVVQSALPKEKKSIGVDFVFLRRVMKLLRIMIPSPLCPEVGYLVLVGVSMLLRTYCDVWMLTNATAIERAIITRDLEAFKKDFLSFILAMAPISVVNNVLKYGIYELKMRFRTRLTTSLYHTYLEGFTYYQVSNIDSRVNNPDQLLTQDVDKFCVSVAELYSNISKPLVDMIIYARALSGTIGIQGPLSMLGYLVLSGIILTRLRRPTGRYTVQEQELEGEFRYVNSRLITHSEEIAFYNGQVREKNLILDKFTELMNHVRHSQQFRAVIGFVDSIIAKYCATAVGFLVLSRPYLSPAPSVLDGMSESELMEDYYRNGRMLINLAKAMGRLVLAGRELTRLAGFTARVTELQEVLSDLGRGQYTRTMVLHDDEVTLKPNSGKVVNADGLIEFDAVPLVTPNGEVLIRSMSFRVVSGMNVLVCGPNGCGKSSLFRTLGGLWPQFGGTITKPCRAGGLFYVPQRPYLAMGTLRDQIIYPQSVTEYRAKGGKDSDLQDLLTQVQLEYILEREGGWEAVEDWQDVLSGGEKQRIAMARLFYHKPQFAILDECTSAVSVDVEGFMYTHCREKLNVTLFTVSHRKSLWKYHDYVLRMNGDGTYTFEAIDKNTEVYGS